MERQYLQAPNDGPRTRLCFGMCAALMLLGSSTAVAQSQLQTQFDKGTPPSQTAGVSQIGSYISSDLGTVNLGNGALNFKIPLGQVGGRGFWLPITLNYSSKIWSAQVQTTTPGSYVAAMYDDPARAFDAYNRIGSGWTIGAVPFLTVRG